MFKFLIKKIIFFYNILFYKELEFLKILKLKTPLYLKILKKRIKRKIKNIIEKFNNPKTFYVYKFFIITYIVMLFKPTPKNIKWYLIKILIKISSLFRNCFFYIITANFNNKHGFVYFYFILFFFFIIKSIQEIYFNFTCPLATYLYGKFKKKKRLLKFLKKKKQVKQKLHKFVADPFYTKEQKKKIQAAKDKIENEKQGIMFEKLKKKKIIWVLDKKDYKKIDPRILNKKKWHHKWFKR